MKLIQKYYIARDALKESGCNGLANLLLSCVSLTAEPLRVRSRPVFIQIEPTVACNLECSMCISPFLKREEEMLSLIRFKEIVKKFPYLRKISLVGAGEPLLNPELFDMIDHAKSRRLNVGFATNATLMDAGISERIVSSGLDWLNISLDGARKETYERIRKGANFETVLGNIKGLMRIKRSKKPDVSVWFLALKSNLEELSDVVLLAYKLGIRSISVQANHYWGKEGWKEKIDGEKIYDDPVRIRRLFVKARNLARERRMRFEYVNVADRTKGRACKQPWGSCYITVDGYVTPCCLHGTDPKVINFGNIFKEEFDSIWNNVKYQAFRKELRSPNIPSVCAACPAYYGKIKI